MTSVQDRILNIVRSKLALRSGKVIVVGVSGSQGSGKTTATRAVAGTLAHEGFPAVSVSIDDFYLPFEAQNQVATQGNALLQKRGLPGTHDIPLLLSTMKAFQDGTATQVPTYDKSRHNGRGDRSGFVQLPPGLRVVLLEGWFIGFRPIGARAIEEHRNSHNDSTNLYSAPDLEQIDHNLAEYVSVWDQCDALVHLEPLSLKFVYQWRLQQEHDLRREYNQGMTDEEVTAFVNQYMPAYELYNGTIRSDEHIFLTFDRQPVASKSESN